MRDSRRDGDAESAGVGPVLLRRLLAHFGSAAAVIAATPRMLAQVEGMGEVRSARFRRAIDEARRSRVAERERLAMRRCGASLLTLGVNSGLSSGPTSGQTTHGPHYPPLLATICDPPLALWQRGAVIANDRFAVAIVGARRCGAYGIAHAARIAGALAERGFTIVSGGARGIDAEAHRAALRAGGRTIAVFGCGLAECYPPEHAELFEQIAGSGALLSEFPCETRPRPEFFPRRNRIVSGLSLGVVVIEAASRSGALITARLAAEEHHREVMALPGSVDSPRSAGCHRAIREGWAALVTGADEIVEQLEGARTLLQAVADEHDGAGVDRVAAGVGKEAEAVSEGRDLPFETRREARDALVVRREQSRPRWPTDEEIADLSTVDAVRLIVDRASGSPEGGPTAAELADRLDRPTEEILVAITTLRLHGVVAEDAIGKLELRASPRATGSASS